MAKKGNINIAKAIKEELKDLQVSKNNMFDTLDSIVANRPTDIPIENKWLRLHYYLIERIDDELQEEYEEYCYILRNWELLVNSVFNENYEYAFVRVNVLGPNPRYSILNLATGNTCVIGSPKKVTEVLLEEFI